MTIRGERLVRLVCSICSISLLLGVLTGCGKPSSTNSSASRASLDQAEVVPAPAVGTNSLSTPSVPPNTSIPSETLNETTIGTTPTFTFSDTDAPTKTAGNDETGIVETGIVETTAITNDQKPTESSKGSRVAKVGTSKAGSELLAEYRTAIASIKSVRSRGESFLVYNKHRTTEIRFDAAVDFVARTGFSQISIPQGRSGLLTPSAEAAIAGKVEYGRRIDGPWQIDERQGGLADYLLPTLESSDGDHNEFVDLIRAFLTSTNGQLAERQWGEQGRSKTGTIRYRSDTSNGTDPETAGSFLTVDFDFRGRPVRFENANPNAHGTFEVVTLSDFDATTVALPFLENSAACVATSGEQTVDNCTDADHDAIPDSVDLCPGEPTVPNGITVCANIVNEHTIATPDAFVSDRATLSWTGRVSFDYTLHYGADCSRNEVANSSGTYVGSPDFVESVPISIAVTDLKKAKSMITLCASMNDQRAAQTFLVTADELAPQSKRYLIQAPKITGYRIENRKGISTLILSGKGSPRATIYVGKPERGAPAASTTVNEHGDWTTELPAVNNEMLVATSLDVVGGISISTSAFIVIVTGNTVTLRSA
jgi:hypothetical protein